MACDLCTVLALSYATEASALADFHAVESLYYGGKIAGTYDAALLTRRDGKVSLLRERGPAGPTDGREGAGIGLALGACYALFPAITLATGAIAGALAGGAVGIVAGHFLAGVSRDALRDLGATLDESEYGLVVIVAQDAARDVRLAVRHAVKAEERALKADCKAIRQELQQLGESA